MIRVPRLERGRLIVFAIAALAYLPGITWGLPYAVTRDRLDVWSPDDIAPLAPLAEMFNTFVAAGEDRFLLYPLFHHFVLAAAYTPYFLWLVATGQFHDPSATYPFGIADPVSAFATLTIIARCISVMMAAGIVVAAYDIALTCWRDRHTAMFAAAAAGAIYPMAYYSKTGNVDVPALFWTALGLAVYARSMHYGLTPPRARLLGCFAALAVATKDQAAAAFLLMPAGFLLPRRGAGPQSHDSAGHPGRGAERQPCGATGTNVGTPGVALAWLIGTGTVVYILASGLAFDPARYIAHISYLFSERDHYVRFAEYVRWYPITLAGVLEHLGDMGAALLWFHGPLVTALAGVGIASSIRQRERAALLLVPAAGHLLLFLLPVRYFYVRFAMALAFILALFAARAFTPLWSRVRQPALRWTVLIAVLLWPLTLSVDLVGQMLRDSRYAASAWFAREVTPGQRVAHFGPAGELPRLDASVRTLRLPPGPAARAAIQSEAPEYVAIQPDWTSAPDVPHSAWCPPDVYRALQDGTLGYLLVGRFRARSLVSRQLLDYPSVNPPVHVYARRDIASRAAP